MRRGATSALSPLRESWTWILLGIYVVLQGVMLVYHEPWRDEAQAWLLARDADPWSLAWNHLRYEGTPGLWHALLLLPAKTGLPYVSVNVISAALGAFAAYLVLRHSPFPSAVRALLPFTFFLFYQYGVVARSYTLLAPLLFLVAIVWPRKKERVYLFTFLLVLLANVSTHGALIAGSLMAVHVLDVVRNRGGLTRDVLRRQVVAAGAFVVVTLLLVVQLRPPSDRVASFESPGLASIRTATSIFNGAITGFEPLSVVVFGALVWWFWRTRTLLMFVVPAVALLALSVFAYHRHYHEGIWWLLALFVLWVGLADRSRVVAAGPRTRQLMLAGVATIVAVHLVWSASSFRFDLEEPYSGSEALANYLKAHAEDKTIYAAGFPSRDGETHPSVGGSAASAVQPYFDRNIYANYHGGRQPSFWEWSTSIDLIYERRRILAARPDLIVLSVVSPRSAKQPALYPGYRVAARFSGDLAWKNGTHEPEAYILMERIGAS